MTEQTELLPCAHCGGEAKLDGHAMEWWVKCQECEALIHLVAAAPQHAAAAWNRRVAPATGWISVDDRLPERGVRVEANAAGGYVFIGYRDAYRKWYEDDNYPIYHVTHWRPLPPPPGSEPALKGDCDDRRRN